MKIGFIGDVHRRFDILEPLVNNMDCDLVIQCGDYGLWVDIENELPDRYKLKFNKLVMFVEGNHDNYTFLSNNRSEIDIQPREICNNLLWMPRGSRFQKGGKKFFFCGGADSIDKEYRLMYYPNTWWSEERIDMNILDYVDKNEEFDFIVTHERPSIISRKLGYEVLNNPISSAFVLDKLFNKVRCKNWIHGHWHENEICKCDDTMFIGLDMLRDNLQEEVDIYWNDIKLGVGTDYYIIMEI